MVAFARRTSPGLVKIDNLHIGLCATMKSVLSFVSLVLLTCSLACAANKDDPLYATYACQSLALKQLKTLGSARFEPLESATAFPTKDGKWRKMTDVWSAIGWVDSQNSFGGALIHSEYMCTVQKTPAGRWQLLDFQWTKGAP